MIPFPVSRRNKKFNYEVFIYTLWHYKGIERSITGTKGLNLHECSEKMPLMKDEYSPWMGSGRSKCKGSCVEKILITKE